MTAETFYQSLRRGLGSAIIELKENPDNSRYRDVLLRCCLRDITYDWTMEGSKGDYLYEAILTFEDTDYFLGPIVDRFNSDCPKGLFRQLAQILFYYACDKNQLAKDALNAKYEYYAQKMGRLKKNAAVDEGMQWDEIAIHLQYIDGFKAFKKYAVDTGNVRLRYPENRKTYDDWYECRAENRFGKERIERYYNSEYEKSAAIKVLVDTIKSDNILREQQQERRKQIHVTVGDLIQAATAAAADKNPRYKMYKLLSSKIYIWKGSEQELLELAHAALNEENPTVKALLLNQFWRKPFPLDITPLIEYAKSENSLLAEVAIARLENINDHRLYELGVQLLRDKGVGSFALCLFKENYRKSDDDIIWAAVKRSKNIPHHVQQDIQDIYRRHRSARAFSTLLRVYRKGECSFCRWSIVEAMKHCGVLSDDILEECLYDFYDDTRTMANRIKKRRNRVSDKTQ